MNKESEEVANVRVALNDGRAEIDFVIAIYPDQIWGWRTRTAGLGSRLTNYNYKNLPVEAYKILLVQPSAHAIKEGGRVDELGELEGIIIEADYEFSHPPVVRARWQASYETAKPVRLPSEILQPMISPSLGIMLNRFPIQPDITKEDIALVRETAYRSNA